MNKSSGRSHTQCVQSRVEPRRREKGQRLGNGSTRSGLPQQSGPQTVQQVGGNLGENARDYRELENLVTQEVQGSRPREHQQHKVLCTPSVRRSPKTPTRGQSAVQPGGDHAKHARGWAPRGDQGAREGNRAFPLLTHLLEGKRGQTGRD